MNSKALALQERAHAFHQKVIRLVDSLPKTAAAESIGSQLVDSAGSASSNYRNACRGRTTAEFIAKIGVAAEEADESKGWLEALAGAKLGNAAFVAELVKEADELTAIFTASEKTARKNYAASQRAQKRRRRST
jgi:four helix bundle protein